MAVEVALLDPIYLGWLLLVGGVVGALYYGRLIVRGWWRAWRKRKSVQVICRISIRLETIQEFEKLRQAMRDLGSLTPDPLRVKVDPDGETSQTRADGQA